MNEKRTTNSTFNRVFNTIAASILGATGYLLAYDTLLVSQHSDHANLGAIIAGFLLFGGAILFLENFQKKQRESKREEQK